MIWEWVVNTAVNLGVICVAVTNYWPWDLQVNDGRVYPAHKIVHTTHPVGVDEIGIDDALGLVESGGASWVAVGPDSLQADDNPGFTAAGWELDWQRDEFVIAAVPLPMINDWVYLPGIGEMRGWDTFGHPLYQAGPFYHPNHKRFVIGVDVLTPRPLYYLECNAKARR